MRPGAIGQRKRRTVARREGHLTRSMGAAWLSGAVLWNIREYRMFIGSINAGNRAADLLSLVSSATRNNLDVLV